jgi:hypothetical protein
VLRVPRFFFVEVDTPRIGEASRRDCELTFNEARRRAWTEERCFDRLTVLRVPFVRRGQRGTDHK